MSIHRKPARAALALSASALALTLAGVAVAQEAAPAAPASDEVEAVVVTGFRASLQSAMNLKRNETGVVDAIKAEDIAKFLSPDQLKVYQLIWQRFVASQMMPAVYDMTIVDFDLKNGKYLLRTSGSILRFDGYHRLYIEGREAEEGKTMDDLSPIPPLAQGDKVEVKAITPAQHFTEPPPRFSEASLVKELERLGIETRLKEACPEVKELVAI